jgi:predicted ATP-binding protein involved in virulence
MKLNSIHLTNYRMHADLEVKFAPGFNVIVGVNGSGKTTVLRGVCEALKCLGYGISINTLHAVPLSDAELARQVTEKTNGRLRFEPQYPVKIKAVGEIFGVPCDWTMMRTSSIGQATITGQYPAQVWQREQNIVAVSGSSTPLPLIAFYRANRQWNAGTSSAMQAATQKQSRMDAYIQWADASLDAIGLQTWAVSKCLERYQTSSETGKSFDAIQDDELALVNAALSVAVENVKGLRYDMKQKSLLVEWAASPHREPTAFENLSDGQRAVIALVADIARRMCLLNPQLGDQVTANTPGVVLIDELDMHLHPHWQRILTNGLKAAFPSLQFIVASHSPQVLGELQPSEIILLRPEGTTHPQVSYGLDSSRVLEEIMGATARTPEVENALSELFTALERNDLPAARTQLAALAERAPGIAELDGARALLKRKEVLGR